MYHLCIISVWLDVGFSNILCIPLLFIIYHYQKSQHEWLMFQQQHDVKLVALSMKLYIWMSHIGVILEMHFCAQKTVDSSFTLLYFPALNVKVICLTEY